MLWVKINVPPLSTTQARSMVPLSLSLFSYRPMNLVHLVNTPVYQLLLTISGGCVLINKSQSISLVLIKTLFNKQR